MSGRREGKARGTIALVAGAGLALGFQIAAIHAQSLTNDEPYHLLAGHQALRYGQNTLNLEHPPLVKLVAALPLLFEAPLAPPTVVSEALSATPAVFREPALARRLRLGSRYALLLAFGLPFLLACFVLGREAAGWPAGVVLLVVVGTASPVIPVLSLVTTDGGAALGFAATLVVIAAYGRRPAVARAVLVGAGLGLAFAAKHSALLLLPGVIAALLSVARRERRWRRGIGHGALAALVALAILHLVYAAANWRYDPEAGRDTIRRYTRNRSTMIVADRMVASEDRLLALERWNPYLAQWATGVLATRIQDAIGVYPLHLFGRVSSASQWWYLPAVFLVKTPLVILGALAGAGAAALGRGGRRRRGPPGGGADPRGTGGGWDALRPALWITALVFVGTLATTMYVAYRHLLPVIAILFLPVARWAARRPARGVALAALLSLESLLVAPLWLSTTNTWWLGQSNPTRFALSLDDTSYKQNLLALRKVAARRGLEPLFVALPGASPAEVAASIPGSRFLEPAAPLAPGWYAVSIRLEQYVPGILDASPDDLFGYRRYARLAHSWAPALRQLVEQAEDHGYVAGTFHLYRLRPLDVAGPRGRLRGWP